MFVLGVILYSKFLIHRGLHVRPDHEGFKLGVQKAQKAIENAVGNIGIPKKNTASNKTTARTDEANTVEKRNESKLCVFFYF